MGPAAMIPDEPQNPFAIGLFSAVSIMVISQDLTNLVHQSKISVRLKIANRIHQFPPRQFLAQPYEIMDN
jgi:hypothetical protein